MIEIIWVSMCVGFLSLISYLAYVYATQGAQAVGETLDQLFDCIYHINNVHKENQ